MIGYVRPGDLINNALYEVIMYFSLWPDEITERLSELAESMNQQIDRFKKNRIPNIVNDLMLKLDPEQLEKTKQLKQRVQNSP